MQTTLNFNKLFPLKVICILNEQSESKKKIVEFAPDKLPCNKGPWRYNVIYCGYVYSFFECLKCNKCIAHVFGRTWWYAFSKNLFSFDCPNKFSRKIIIHECYAKEKFCNFWDQRKYYLCICMEDKNFLRTFVNREVKQRLCKIRESVVAIFLFYLNSCFFRTTFLFIIIWTFKLIACSHTFCPLNLVRKFLKWFFSLKTVRMTIVHWNIGKTYSFNL